VPDERACEVEARQVDFDTNERIPKLSAGWFRETARKNALV
jgi:beta-glucosidase/6-phospho-beta-glucosidase/beta-galactosidase